MDFRWEIQYQFWVVCPFKGPLRLCLCKRTGKRSICRHELLALLIFSLYPSPFLRTETFSWAKLSCLWKCYGTALPMGSPIVCAIKPLLGLTFWGLNTCALWQCTLKLLDVQCIVVPFIINGTSTHCRVEHKSPQHTTMHKMCVVMRCLVKKGSCVFFLPLWSFGSLLIMNRLP